MDIKIAVAAHKQSEMPKDSMYIPVQAGALEREAIYEMRDDLGENIASKNPFYSELTVLYSAWKNWDYDALGLVHYRRYFTLKNRFLRDRKNPLSNVVSYGELEKLFEKADILVPKKMNYYIESIFSHYSHTFTSKHLEVARQVVADSCPEYLKYVDKVYGSTSACMMNMFIMKRDYVEDYCSWLFPILESMEEKIDVSELDTFEKRLFGRVSEILFNVWLLKKIDEGAKVSELKQFYTEPVNWGKKITGFLAAKFLGKKYTKSF